MPKSRPRMRVIYLVISLPTNIQKIASSLTMTPTILRTCVLVLILPLALSAQTPMSNIVNRYAAVTRVGSNYAVTPGSIAFTVDDTVLLIQMKGATIDTSNTPAFGTVTAYNSAGNFEFLIIQCRNADTLFFTSALSKTYEASGRRGRQYACRITPMQWYRTRRPPHHGTARRVVWLLCS